MKGGSTDEIKADTEALEKAFYPLAEKLYAEANPQGGAAGATQNEQGDVYGTDFEDKTDKN